MIFSGDNSRRANLIRLAWIGSVALACSAAPDGTVAADPAPPPAQADVGSYRLGGAVQAAGSAAAASVPAAEPAAAAGGALNGASRFELRDIVIDGNTVLDKTEIEEIVARYRGKSVSIGDLDEARRELTGLYIKEGYINSGVIIPNQNVTQGIVRFQAIEGRITGVEVTGAHSFKPEYFSSRLERSWGTPFNIKDAEEEQQILLQGPQVQRLNIDLAPGVTPGEAKMKTDVTESSPYSLSMQIADDQSPTVGEIRGQMAGSVANLWGTGDVLSAEYGRSQGLNDGSVSYSIPIAPDDTTVSVKYDRNGTLVVAPALAPLDVTSDYSSVSVGVSRPFYRTAEQKLSFEASFDWRQAQSFLLGTPFPFTAGADPNGRTNVSALRLTGLWEDHNPDHALVLRSTLSIGLPILGATVQPPLPGETIATGEFVSWLGQAQYVRRIYHDWEAVLRSDVQLSNGPLFPIEQFALGGIDTVRGYRDYLMVTDDAAFGSAELRIPIATLPVPQLSEGDAAGTLQFVPFYDYGRGWNVDRPTPAPPDISSVGVGLRWLIGPGTTAELYYGRALRNVPVGTSLQDRGIHFRLTAGFL